MYGEEVSGLMARVMFSVSVSTHRVYDECPGESSIIATKRGLRCCSPQQEHIGAVDSSGMSL
eukprot:11734854-Prorocentrum_lima.AAC.1